MKDSLLSIYRAVAEGRLAQAEALVRIRALKRQASDAAQGVLLATPEWAAASATSAPAQPVDRIFVWGVDPAVTASLKATHGDARFEAFAPPANVTAADEIFTDAALQGLAAIQSMLAGARGVRALVIVADTGAVDEEAADEAVACGFDAMFRTAMEETPALVARVIRVPADIGAAELRQLVHDESCADAPRGAAVRHVRDAGGLRREVLRWRVLEQHLEGHWQSAAPVAFREGGCYLITGGAGGVGLQFAREIVAQCRSARIVLAGRSTLAPEARRTLDALATPLHRIEYVELDVADRSAVDALVAQLREQDQPLHGILHCAGIIRDGFILRKSPSTFASVLAPKVAGLANLDLATRDLPLDFIVLCSSFAACWGIVGQVDYAAANAFMDAFAAHRNRLAARGERHGRTLSVNWPLWQDGGMSMDAATHERLHDHTGMRPLSTVAAMRAMYRGLALPCERLLVMEGELPAMRALLEATDSATASAAGTARETARGSATARVADATPVGMDDALREKALDYLCRQFSQVLKIPAARLRPQAPLEQYGIDSILAMKLVTHLETIFGRLPKTLAFEYQTIAQLNDYFCNAHADRLISLLSPLAAPPDTATGSSATTTATTAARSHVPGKRVGTARRTSHAIQPQPHAEAQPVAFAARSDADRRGTDAAIAMARIDKPSVDDEPILSPSLHSESIAIVGISGRYPDAWDLDEYWRNLSQGVDCIREIPADRWRWQDYYTSDREQPGHYSKWGGFIQGADEFDPRFFSITPRDAEQIDPQERLFLQHAWMAIEDAGYTRAGLQACRGGQVGVYAGVMYGEYNRSGSLASIANRVSYALNLHGPSMTLDTMCSSSLTAIHLACQDLKLGRTDMALAGGVNLSIHPDKYSMLSAGQFISSAGHCQSFGEGGDGYIPGEGVGVVVLKRLSDAERDGDAIHAVIRGSALNHGGKTNGYTVPNPQAQAAVISAALKDAGVDARHISYIEAHGTGTKLGDPIEIAALDKAFREYTADTGFCLIGSAKSNIGHCESAAGIAGLTKVILQMRHRQIAPSLHSQRLNPNIDFGTTPFEVNQSLRDWDAPVVDGRRMSRIAGLSSFGAGGANAHLVIEEPAVAAHAHIVDATLPGAPTIVPLSARTSEQLLRKAQDLLAFLQDAEEEGRRINHTALAYTLQVGREPMEERLALVVDSAARLQQLLRAFVEAGGVDAAADGAYRGNSKAHREMLGLFAADPDYEEALDKWIAQRKLAKLAELWAKGFDLDWRKFHGRNTPPRMHLPTYPFAKDRYWIDPIKGLFSNVVPSGAASRTGAVSAAAGTALHPLLRENTSDLDQLRYSSLFQPDEPFVVRDSDGTGAQLPSSVLLDMARAAVACAKRASPTSATVELSEVRFASPFLVDGATALHIALYPSSEHDGIDFDIFSGEAEEEYVHAQGRGRLLPTQAGTQSDPQAEAWIDAGTISPAEVLDTVPVAFVAAPVLEKPGAITLPEPAAVPAIVGGLLPKPNASRLPMLDAATPIAAMSAAPVTNRTTAQVNAASRIDISPNTASPNGASPAQDVRGFLRRSLAQALYLDEANIDDDRPFVDLGLDSIVGVEWVKNINKGLGLEIGATRVYDYSNLTALGAFVESQLSAVSTTPGTPVRAVARPASVVQALPASDAPALDEHALVEHALVAHSPAAPLPAPVAQTVVGVDHDALKRSLRMSLAQALYLDEAAIDDERSFVDLGLDSIVGVEWVKMINKAYGLEISATRVYDYSNVEALARFLQGELASRPRPVAPAPALAASARAESASMPAAQRETPTPAATSSFAAAASFAPRPAMRMPAGDSIVLQRRSRAVRTLPQARLAAGAQRNDEKIAIVGMSGRYPGAEDLDQLWRNLAEGRNSIREIPSERWDVDAYYDPTPGKPGKVYCKWLGMLDGAEHFDPMFFQISPAEAEVMDPQHRLFMQESYRAFQDAGYSSAALSDRKCGVYMGIMSSDYSFLLAKGNPQNIETTSNSFAIGAARIAYHLNLKGPAIPIDTACSSSLVAIHLACQALRNHEIDIGLAGGVSLYLIPESYLGMCRAGMLAHDGQCKTFDNGADGFVPGEGVGTLVLKRLSDAERDGDSIYGVIIGSGINQDGKTNGITAPSVNSQIELLRDTYRRYAIDASSIDYVETHGTGTKLGDPIELEALSTVFKEHGARKNACALGAIKTNLGHTSGAAGVAGVHKVLLSLRNKVLAPNVNLRQENALFDFAASPFYVSRTRHDWPSVAGRKRRAAVSAFGFSGTNAHVVIEEYVPALRSRGAAAPMDASPSCIVPLSARTAAQLMVMAQDLLAFLDKDAADKPDSNRRDSSDAEIALRDLAYTLQTGRDPMRERCAWVVGSVAELRTHLREFLSTSGAGTCHRGAVSRTQDAAIPTEDAADLLLRNGLHQSAAALWAQGAKIEWPSFYADDLPQRLHGLPGYPFAKERYWPEPVPAPAPAARPSSPAPLLADSGEEKRSTYYAPVWRDAAVPAPRAAFRPDDVLLIIDTDDQLFEQIQARLHIASPLKTILLVRLGDAFRQDATDQFCVDPAQPQHFESLLETLRRRGRTPTRVIHNANAARLSAHAGEQANRAADEAIERALNAGIDALFGFCRALSGAGAQQAPCAFVSFFHASAEANTAPCEALAAFYRSLALENNRYHGRVLSIEHDDIDPATTVFDTVTALLDELQSAPQRETEVRYRTYGAAEGQRSVRALALQSPERAPAGPMPLKHRGTYLITGGLGGLGILFARHLAEHYRARLAISGRSALDARVEEALEQLRALGAEAVYLQADIADADQTRTLIADVKARFGALNGVLHSAGVNDDALLIRKGHSQFRRVLAPKVQGTLHLDRFTADEPLDLFVLFSSGAGCFGNVGQTDYAYANAFMDAFADHREAARARGTRYGRTLSIGWPYWQAGGMQLSAADLQRTEERTGLCALPTEIGFDYWNTLLRSGLPRALALYGHPSKIAAYCDPSSTAIATAQAGGATIDRGVLLAQTRAYLCELVHAETRIPADRIDIEERFEAFGFDSIMIGRVNAALEQDLGDLPKTLMYEYETIAELAAYLTEHAAAALTARFAGEGATHGGVNVAESTADATPSTAASTAMRSHPPTVAAPAPDAHVHAEPIAIIGVHVSFPQADDMDALWAHLRAGTDLIEDVPENRWDASSFYDPDPAQSEHGKIYCKRGGFLEDFDKFDAGFFNIAAAEADIIDPQERRFLQSAWSAIEDAGYTRERLKQRYPKGKSADVGVFVGVTTNSYQLLAPEARQRGRMVTPSAMPWSIANRVSYTLDLQGPSIPVDTACSSSLVAVHLACESLRRSECQLALAGGVNLYLHPAKYQSFCHRRMLAVGDACRSYGAGDDGFIPGEGVGTLVLKPLRLAERDGDRVYGVIRGSAYDHSGRSSGYATPNPNAQAHVIAQALAQAGVPARSIGFIEGHGTGTRMGDSLEVAAITQAFAQQTADTGFCALASLKANIGHAESATSIAGIAKILMQFKHRQIAPSIHAEVVNPDIDFAHSPCVLQAGLSDWDAPVGVPRRALINAFGAGGVNACAVLEEYVAAELVASTQADAPVAGAGGSPGGSLFVLSAMNVERLREYAHRYVDFLALNPGCDLEALCRTAQIGREAMPQRLALIVDNAPQLRQTLLRWLDADPNLSSTARLWQGGPETQTGAGYTAREQRERMQALCAEADLAGLAVFWTRGGKVDWLLLHDAPLRPVTGAPVYPFARDRHWAVDFSTMEAAPASTPSRLHPLISHNASTLERVCFDAALVGDQYYARDHKIQGQAVFPGAGFIEMACIAATVAGQRRVRRLKDIYWVQPLSLTDPQKDLKIALSNATGDSVELVVTTVDDDHESILHFEARALFDDRSGPESSSRESLPEWRQRCGASHDGARYYKLFQRLGFDYGPTFRVIDEVAIGNGCALAKLVLALSSTKDFEQYVLHPCLIDGALQTVVALLAADEGGVPHLPFAIDEIEILGSLTPHCLVLVERSSAHVGAGTGILVFNVHILSESGETLVKITNFYVRALVPPPSSIATHERARLAMAVDS